MIWMASMGDAMTLDGAAENIRLAADGPVYQPEVIPFVVDISATKLATAAAASFDDGRT
jgi:hypothetical protein